VSLHVKIPRKQYNSHMMSPKPQSTDKLK